MKHTALILCIAVSFLMVAPALGEHTIIRATPDKFGNVGNFSKSFSGIAAVQMHGQATFTSTATLTIKDPHGWADKTIWEKDGVTTDNFKIRLLGVSPLGSNYLCREPDGTDHECTSMAIRVLRDRIAGKPVRCEVRANHDEDGLPLATCFAADGQNLNAWMLRHGYAFRTISEQYRLHEELARAEGAGVWLFIKQPREALAWNLKEAEDLDHEEINAMLNKFSPSVATAEERQDLYSALENTDKARRKAFLENLSFWTPTSSKFSSIGAIMEEGEKTGQKLMRAIIRDFLNKADSTRELKK